MHYWHCCAVSESVIELATARVSGAGQLARPPLRIIGLSRIFALTWSAETASVRRQYTDSLSSALLCDGL